MRYIGFLVVAGFITGLLLAPLQHVTAQPAEQASDCRVFIATHQSICGKFLSYWNSNGQLEEQGYPLSAAIQESRDDGKTYKVQYFERSVFEYHPENIPPNDVLLTRLGSFRYQEKYPNGALNQHPSSDNQRVFTVKTDEQTRLGGSFRSYWEKHGGLHQWGIPISDEFEECSDQDGALYTVQYFERAVFEYHPANDLDHQVLLKPLGAIRYNTSYRGALTLAPIAPSPCP